MDIKIRHAEKGDTAAIKEIYEQTHAIEGTLQLPFPSFAMWESRGEKWGEDFKNIVAVVNKRVVGHLGLQVFTQPRRKHAATFGMAVCSSVIRQGVGEVILKEAIEACDNWFNIVRLEIQVYVDNEAGIELYKKFGFVIEGTNIQYGYKKGKYVDVYTMARMRRET